MDTDIDIEFAEDLRELIGDHVDFGTEGQTMVLSLLAASGQMLVEENDVWTALELLQAYINVVARQMVEVGTPPVVLH